MSGRRDGRSAEAARYQRLYKLRAWRDGARPAQLAKQPLCELCLQRGRTVPADTVNHREPHKGDWALFINPDNHQSVCRHCHSGAIQSFERTGRMRGCDANGVPLDGGHHWQSDAR